MKCRRSVTCLAILIFLLTEHACAEGRKSILERLYSNAAPPEAAEILVEPLHLSKSEGPCSLTVGEVLFDGSALYVSWTARSDFETLLLFLPGNLQSPSLALQTDGDYDRLSPYNIAALGDALDEKSMSREYHGLSCALLPDGGALEPFDVTIQGFFLKPTMPVVSDSPFRNDPVSDPAWVPGWTQEYFLPYSDAATDDDQSWDAYLNALQRKSSYPEILDGLMTSLTESGYAQLLTQVSLTFTVTPDAEHIFHTEIEGQSTFEFDDCTVEFVKADFSAARFLVVGTIAWEKSDSADLSGLHYDICPDGNASWMQKSEWIVDISADGLSTIDFFYYGNSPETPSFLLFEASMETKGDLVRMPERDITLRLAKVP